MELLLHQSLFQCGYYNIKNRLYVFMPVDIWIRFVWIFTPCTLMGTQESFEGVRSFHLQCRGVVGECATRLYRSDFLNEYLPCYRYLVLHRNIITQELNRVPYIPYNPSSGSENIRPSVLFCVTAHPQY
jgi:hypothetical protein